VTESGKIIAIYYQDLPTYLLTYWLIYSLWK